MAFDPFADETVRPQAQARNHVVGQDLSTLSIEEIDERIAALRQEITRLEQMRAQKQASKSAADAVFKA
ncbi:MAG: putative small protein containing a coiled-coil domain [Saliniramus fredricksonii]|uniref:Putative small protein containing a coiled-coil domain n=1 Tax=Saliniramus fredricksonii TaxID=1653334 RepID=A0A0P8A763_9HYPH|nr:DUF1192 domain-containing protein [Saliniramus fredricksonii]KPQ11027.1 MAG: putative small protein containing a coiled-coil domain [Saliniramus fredricksonii]SCC81834.1 Uncharacterized small protein, DUF1192 family [Saliniramus fredricksonii]